MMKIDVIGLGALNYDRLYFVERIAAPGEEVWINDHEESSGGSAANTIVGLSRLGLSCGFIGAVGDDPEGERILKDLADDHVDTAGLKHVSPRRSGTVIGFVDQSGERALYVDAGANSDLSLDDIRIDYVRQARLIHTSSFVDRDQLLMQIELAKILKGDIAISFSPGMLCFRHSFDELSELFKGATIIFVSENELRSLTGQGIEASCASLIEVSDAIIAVTLGKNGSYIAKGDLRLEVMADPISPDEVVDTTGAGDAYAAGFICGYLRGDELETSARLGSKVASYAIRGAGARFLPGEEFVK